MGGGLLGTGLQSILVYGVAPVLAGQSITVAVLREHAGAPGLRSHLAQQQLAGVRRKLVGAVEPEEVSPWQRENVDESMCPVDGLFARVVWCGHGDVLVWHSETKTSSPLGDRRTP